MAEQALKIVRDNTPRSSTAGGEKASRVQDLALALYAGKNAEWMSLASPLIEQVSKADPLYDGRLKYEELRRRSLKVKSDLASKTVRLFVWFISLSAIAALFGTLPAALAAFWTSQPLSTLKRAALFGCSFIVALTTVGAHWFESMRAQTDGESKGISDALAAAAHLHGDGSNKDGVTQAVQRLEDALAGSGQAP